MASTGTSPDFKECTQTLRQANTRIAELESELSKARELLDEHTATIELLQSDLKRYEKAYSAGRPNCPERVPADQLQLAFERVLEYVPPAAPANDLAAEGTPLRRQHSQAPAIPVRHRGHAAKRRSGKRS